MRGLIRVEFGNYDVVLIPSPLLLILYTPVYSESVNIVS